jgi:hypothetical protein
LVDRSERMPARLNLLSSSGGNRTCVSRIARGHAGYASASAQAIGAPPEETMSSMRRTGYAEIL